MNELEQIFTEMLNHVDDHKEAYNKPQWTNEAIVKTWIKTNESKLKNLFISGVSQRSELLLAVICEYNRINTYTDIKKVEQWLEKWDSK